MSERNCVNCGAVIESHADKCPYCGTSYFDFTNIDVHGKPVVLKIRHNDQILILKAFCSSCDISIEHEAPYIYMDHQPVRLTTAHANVAVNVEFQGVSEFI